MVTITAKLKSKYGGKKLGAIANALPAAVREGLRDGGSEMEKAAKLNVYDGHTLTGQLAESIRLEFDSAMGPITVAAIRTDALVQAYTLEYGADGQHGGKGQIPWFVHESQTPYDLHEIYGFAVKKTKAGKFYVIPGLPPHPYMSPAFDATKDTVIYSVSEAVKSAIERA